MYPDPRGSAQSSSASGSTASRGGFYPVLGQPSPSAQNHRPAEPQRQPQPPPPQVANSSQQNPLLRVEIAEPFRTQPPVILQLGPEAVPRTQAAFDFDLERRVASEDASSSGAAPATVDDPFQLILERYTQMGYEHEEVAMALAAQAGQEEDEDQVVDFLKNYRQLKSMGFQAPVVTGALIRHKDDLAAATEACLNAQ